MPTHCEKNYQMPGLEGTPIGRVGIRNISTQPNPGRGYVAGTSLPMIDSRSGKSWNSKPDIPISASELAQNHSLQTCALCWKTASMQTRRIHCSGDRNRSISGGSVGTRSSKKRDWSKTKTSIYNGVTSPDAT